jgi:hypothetical protein
MARTPIKKPVKKAVKKAVAKTRTVRVKVEAAPVLPPAPKPPGGPIDKVLDLVKWVDSPFKLATVIVLGVLGLGGYIVYQQQDLIVGNLTTKEKVLGLVEDDKLSSLSRDLLRNADAQTVIIHQIDLLQNLRLTRIAQSSDGRYTPLEGLRGSFFSSADVRNRASTSILNGEILCEPFEATSAVGDWILSRGVTYTCRGPIPPEAGNMIGYIAVGFNKVPRDLVSTKALIHQSALKMVK